MFYLTTHSTHFIHNYMGRKGNVLFNDALNPFYSQLYGKERKGNVLFNDALNTFYSLIIWHRTYGKGSLR